MKYNIKKILKALISIMLICLVSCASQAIRDKTMMDLLLEDLTNPVQPPIPENLRYSIGKIGVASSYYRPKSDLLKPMDKGGATLHGAGVGFLGSIGAGCGRISYFPIFCIYGVFLAPATGLIGGVVGAVKGEGSEDVIKADTVLNNYLSNTNLQEALTDYILKENIYQAGYPMIKVEGQGPRKIAEIVQYDLKSVDNVDTILEVGVTKVDFFVASRLLLPVEHRINPNLILYVTANVKIINSKTMNTLHQFSIVYDKGNKYKYLKWGSDDGKLFKEELDNALISIAKNILEVIHQIQVPPVSFPVK